MEIMEDSLHSKTLTIVPFYDCYSTPTTYPIKRKFY